MNPIPEQIVELAAANALGALNPSDQLQLNTWLDHASPTVKAFNDVAGLLGASQQSPVALPSGLKSKVMARISARKNAPATPSIPLAFFTQRGNEGEWLPGGAPGVRVKELVKAKGRNYKMLLYELAPGAHFPSHYHSGAEECFVVSGDFHVEGQVLHAGDFHHAENDSEHGESFSTGGCQLLIVACADDYKS